MFAFNDDDDSKLASDRDGAVESVFNLVGKRGGGDVVIIRCAAEQEIPHAAADPKGAEAGVLKLADDARRKVPQLIGRAAHASPQTFLMWATPAFASSAEREGLNS